MQSPCGDDELARAMSPLACNLYRDSLQSSGGTKPLLLIGHDKAFTAAQEQAACMAQADLPVLISGETGSGKELFARTLHLLSSRARSTYIAANCAQFSDGIMAVSQLFGHRRGSFTGALVDTRGLFGAADAGTLLLDEIGELDTAVQAVLLRTLSEGEVLAIGDAVPRRVDVRVIAASAKDLMSAVSSGTFRSDLFFRLCALHVVVPALRQRPSDIPLLARYYLRLLNGKGGRQREWHDSALDVLVHYSWPGNVRQLKGVAELAFYRSLGFWIKADDLDLACASVGCTEEPTMPHASRECLGLTGGVGGLGDDEASLPVLHFWRDVRDPFSRRDLNRLQVRSIVCEGLGRAAGSYRRFLRRYGVEDKDYLKAMDFLRHHDLKPLRSGLVDGSGRARARGRESHTRGYVD